MSNNEIQWNARYQNKPILPPPCQVLQQHTYLLPQLGRALDLACGLGANALLLAQQGLETEAWDYAETALQQLQVRAQQQQLTIKTVVRDVVTFPPEKQCFDVIVVCHFLERTLFPHLINALKPQGLLFYQTFTQVKINDAGPRHMAYRLAENELLQLASNLSIVSYNEAGILGDTRVGLRNEAWLIGQKKNDFSLKL
jgi:2-polyprenyl-3-methyl-5-hydroxy-6-metoxy-1,4-benzoquinol methylase